MLGPGDSTEKAFGRARLVSFPDIVDVSLPTYTVCRRKTPKGHAFSEGI